MKCGLPSATLPPPPPPPNSGLGWAPVHVCSAQPPWHQLCPPRIGRRVCRGALLAVAPCVATRHWRRVVRRRRTRRRGAHGARCGAPPRAGAPPGGPHGAAARSARTGGQWEGRATVTKRREVAGQLHALHAQVDNGRGGRRGGGSGRADTRSSSAQVSELRLENESLKRHAHAASHAAAHPSLAHDLAHSQQQQHGRGGAGGVLVPRSDLQELERQLRDKAAQVGAARSHAAAASSSPHLPLPLRPGVAAQGAPRPPRGQGCSRAGALRPRHRRARPAERSAAGHARGAAGARQRPRVWWSLQPSTARPSPSSPRPFLLQAAETDVDLLRGRAAAATQIEAELRTAREETRRLEVRHLPSPLLTSGAPHISPHPAGLPLRPRRVALHRRGAGRGGAAGAARDAGALGQGAAGPGALMMGAGKLFGGRRCEWRQEGALHGLDPAPAAASPRWRTCRACSRASTPSWRRCGARRHTSRTQWTASSQRRRGEEASPPLSPPLPLLLLLLLRLTPLRLCLLPPPPRVQAQGCLRRWHAC